MFSEDKVHFYFSSNDVSQGTADIVCSPASLSMGILYFISERFNYRKNVIQIKNKKFIAKVKEIILELSPGLLIAVSLLSMWMYYEFIYDYHEDSFLSSFLSLFLQFVSYNFGIHLCNVIILKFKTYIHHKFAFIIIISTVFLFSILSISADNYFKLNIYNILYYVLIIIYHVSMALGYVIQKYLIQKKFCNIYYTQFMAGIGSFVVILPCVFISHYSTNWKGFFEMSLGYPELIEFFIYNLLWNFFYIKVLSTLDPIYFGLEDLILVMLADGLFKKWILCPIIVFIGCLIYTESLIINACGLSYYCEINIRKRGEDEAKQLTEDRQKGNYSQKDIDLVDIGNSYINV
jgi:hypothetical protein